MSEASVSLGANGELRLAGVLDYSTGPALRAEGQALVRRSESSEVVLDCSAVEKSSSVGLALLLAFMRDAKAAGKNARLRGLPADMRQIAQVSELLELLPQEA
ncbi:STAS domain-containing protein [Pseudomonas indica]|uniref:Phospholipid transport system transporter-binding protein n=1 Tax=Pseudomonas indica TaxID=137658 RepID=A0A1G9FGG5_9PSED|nr:STAS domain-containing protein [Pseudomonas indica]SDK87459.1 phospholipid transport system transporter-binding protein [Pseudomonas indica]